MNVKEDLAAWGLRIPENWSLDKWAASLGDKPCQNTAALVGVASTLFLAAERQHNPKVKDIYDAMIYCSTCLSVGYGDIFAKTPVGKLIGTALMTIGPAMTSKAMDGPPDPAVAEKQKEILSTLQQILAEMQKKQP